jgi:hypothetical protein
MIHFDSTDEDFFTLNGYSDEILFAVSKNLTFLKRATNKYSSKSLARILELADQLDFSLFALVEHARTCPDQSLPGEADDLFCSFSPINAAAASATGVTHFHPTRRQKEFCYFSKCILEHSKHCRNQACPVEYCHVFKEIIEFRYLFSNLKI